MISFKTTICLLVSFIITNSLSTETLQANGNTFVTEVIKPFDMPVDDFKIAALNQLSRNDFRTNNFAGDNVTVSKLVYKTIYNGSGRIIDPETNSSHHSVTGDSVDVIVTYQALVHPLTTRKNYNGTTSLKIYLNYTKEINTTLGTTEFQNINVRVDSSSFIMNYSGTPTSGDKKILQSINNGTSSKNKTILSLLQKEEFSVALIEEVFNDNIVNQKLSPTYNSSYLYQFGAFNVTFDMSTSKVEALDGGILNSMKGAIKGFNANEQEQIKTELNEDADYHTLFTVGFMKNMIEASVSLNQDWKGFKLDRNRFKTASFGWRLIDLEYILDGWKEKYGKYYLNSIRVVCDPKALDKIGIDQVSDKMHVQTNWTCKCNLLDVSPSPLLLDFDVKLTYIITFKVDRNAVDVMIDKTYIDSFIFRDVEGMTVSDLKLLKHHSKQMVQNIRGYSIGTNFKVKEGSQKIALKENEGLWVA